MPQLERRSQLWIRSESWPRELYTQWGSQKKKKKKKKKKKNSFIAFKKKKKKKKKKIKTGFVLFQQVISQKQDFILLSNNIQQKHKIPNLKNDRLKETEGKKKKKKLELS